MCVVAVCFKIEICCGGSVERALEFLLWFRSVDVIPVDLVLSAFPFTQYRYRRFKLL
jgi:hypothetical protein